MDVSCEVTNNVEALLDHIFSGFLMEDNQVSVYNATVAQLH